MRSFLKIALFFVLVTTSVNSMAQVTLESSNGVTIKANIKYLFTHYDTTQFCDFDHYKIEVIVENSNDFAIAVHYEVHNSYNYCSGGIAGTNNIETPANGEFIDPLEDLLNYYETDIRTSDGAPQIGYSWRWEKAD